MAPRQDKAAGAISLPPCSARIAKGGSRAPMVSRCTHERRLIRSMGALSQPLGLRRAETRGLNHEPPGKCRSQIGCGRDHPLDCHRLLPSDLDGRGWRKLAPPILWGSHNRPQKRQQGTARSPMRSPVFLPSTPVARELHCDAVRVPARLPRSSYLARLCACEAGFR